MKKITSEGTDFAEMSVSEGVIFLHWPKMQISEVGALKK